jgi:hypothetical protein
MRNRTRLFTMLFFLACVTALAPEVTAQQDDIREWESRRAALERVSEARHRPAPLQRSLILTQRRQDFRRILVLNHRLQKTTAMGGSLDLEFVAKSASEINKCAKRLKHGLALEKAEGSPSNDGTQIETGNDQVSSSLKELGKLIDAFANNPAFKDLRVVNASSLIDAGRELDEIIQLSSDLKRSSSRQASREKAVRESSDN